MRSADTHLLPGSVEPPDVPPPSSGGTLPPRRRRRRGYLGGPVPAEGERHYRTVDAVHWWSAPEPEIDGVRLRELHGYGLTTAEIAEELGVLRVHIAEWCFLNGVTPNPTFHYRPRPRRSR